MMETERVFSLKNVWFTASVGAVIGIAVVAALIGFIWIPLEQSNKTVAGLWDAICRAAGVPESFRQVQQSAAPIAGPSNVVVSAQMMKPADGLSIGRGATLAPQCTMCHGVRGMSHADAPNLAGQYDAAIYKQIYKIGDAAIAGLRDIFRRRNSMCFSHGRVMSTRMPLVAHTSRNQRGGV